MAIYKAVLSTWLDTTEPGDAMQITPHFQVAGALQDTENLANDLLTAWNSYIQTGAQGTQQRCAIYDVSQPAPNYPKTVQTRFQDVVKPSTLNRDVAICLSYYAGFNRPRYRGRLYIPACLVTTTIAGSNAAQGQMDKVAALVPILAGLGGVNVDWGVYSRVDNVFRKATDYWVDNAWDTQRRRGKKSTARSKGTTSG